MKPLEGFRETLYKEMLARIQETDESVPYRRHGYWYYAREVEGLQYPIYCRRKGSHGGARGGAARRERAGQGPQVHCAWARST